MDAQSFIDCILGPGVDCECADMNEDGAVTPTDIPLFVTAMMNKSC